MLKNSEQYINFWYNKLYSYLSLSWVDDGWKNEKNVLIELKYLFYWWQESEEKEQTQVSRNSTKPQHISTYHYSQRRWLLKYRLPQWAPDSVMFVIWKRKQKTAWKKEQKAWPMKSTFSFKLSKQLSVKPQKRWMKPVGNNCSFYIEKKWCFFSFPGPSFPPHVTTIGPDS